MPGDRVFMSSEDHHDILVSALKAHLSSSALADCTLAAEGQYIKAHKLILSSCSPYFQLLFSEVGDKHPIVILKDVKYHHLKGVLDYVYSGKVEIRQHELRTFLETTNCLQIKGLQSGGTEDNSKRRAENAALSVTGLQNGPRQNVITSEENMNRKENSKEAGDQVNSFQFSAHTEQSQDIPCIPDSFEVHPENSLLDTDSPSSSTISILNTYSMAPNEQTISEDGVVSRENYQLPSTSTPSCLSDTLHIKTELSEETRVDSSVDGSQTAEHSGVDNYITAMEVVKNEQIAENVCDSLPSSSDQTTMDSSTVEERETDFVNPSQPTSLQSQRISKSGTDLSLEEEREESSVKQSTSQPRRALFQRLCRAPLVRATIFLQKRVTAKHCNARDTVSTEPPMTATQSTKEKISQVEKTTASLAVPVTKSVLQSPKTRGYRMTRQCSICSKIFATTTSLKKHMRIHSGGRPYKCDDCGKSFVQDVHLLSHRRIHTGKRAFKCDQCESTFRDRSLLKNHRNTHYDDRPFKCKDCGKSFKQSTTLKKHYAVHTEERPLKCDDCGSTFRHRTALKSHRLVHVNERPFKCKDCGKTFKMGSSFLAHAVMHTGERPFKCDECGSTFKHASSLAQHHIVHSKERPFKCDECGNSFKHFATLKSHIRAHSGSRPYKCDKCDKSFNHRTALRNHRLVHSEDHPFHCEVCKSSFKHFSVLVRHRAIHKESENSKGRGEKVEKGRNRSSESQN